MLGSRVRVLGAAWTPLDGVSDPVGMVATSTAGVRAGRPESPVLTRRFGSEDEGKGIMCGKRCNATMRRECRKILEERKDEDERRERLQRKPLQCLGRRRPGNEKEGRSSSCEIIAFDSLADNDLEMQ